jgi:acyl-CoA reductase-like NAD-dependent aldehyde dehydrogenase
MDEKNLQKHLDALGDNINEVMSSTVAVKGEQFAKCVALAFESFQIAEALTRLSALVTDERRRQLADMLRESGTDVLSIMVGKSLEPLSESDVDEVMTMAKMLYRRRNEATESIRREANGN